MINGTGASDSTSFLSSVALLISSWFAGLLADGALLMTRLWIDCIGTVLEDAFVPTDEGVAAPSTLVFGGMDSDTLAEATRFTLGTMFPLAEADFIEAPLSVEAAFATEAVVAAGGAFCGEGFEVGAFVGETALPGRVFERVFEVFA